MKPPPETCPTIDRLSVGLDAISGDLETFKGDYLEFHPQPDHGEVAEIVDQTIAGLQRARFELEELRKANEQLRECGRFWYQKCKAGNLA